MTVDAGPASLAISQRICFMKPGSSLADRVFVCPTSSTCSGRKEARREISIRRVAATGHWHPFRGALRLRRLASGILPEALFRTGLYTPIDH